jgi:hypothetical protein
VTADDRSVPEVPVAEAAPERDPLSPRDRKAAKESEQARAEFEAKAIAARERAAELARDRDAAARRRERNALKQHHPVGD